jgi:predicted phage terminase large subunit-like protein
LIKLLEIELPKLHAAQKAIKDSPARFKVVACGRRFGKGVLGVLLCFLCALTAFSVPPRKGFAWWICPSFQSASFTSGWRLAVRLAEQIPGATVHLQSKLISFENGGWIQFKSAEEPDSLRGEGLDFAIVDEAAHVKKLQEIWEQCLRATLSDRKGKAMFISTPKGFNYFHELYKRGEAWGDPEWASFHYRSKDRPSFDPTEYDAAKLELPALVFRQEYDAEFVQLAGALFKREYFKIVDTPPQTTVTVRFWDLAFTTKTVSDFTAGAKCGLTTDGDFIVHNVVHGRYEWPAAIRIVSDMAKADGPGVIQAIETVGAQVGFEQTLQADPTLANIAIQQSHPHKDKVTRAMPLLTRAEQRGIILQRAPWNSAFIDEFCAFPESDHDDQVDATSGALSCIAQPKLEMILI